MPGYDEEFNQLRAAKAWGLDPRRWCEESVDDRALMLALVLFEGTVEAYRMEHRQKKPGDASQKPDGAGMFSAMKRRMREGK